MSMSASGSSSSLANGYTSKSVTPSNSREIASKTTRKLSLSKLPSTTDLEPDELFTKYTISEVKFVQQQLRADADAKQEELRLMVGERYRDLLQASTSIISIARSSRRVLEALDETKSAISAQKVPPLPRKSIATGAQDTHLHTLQLLSAHVKLLLDAPEHLWRLIERKKYFTAAWLFLLSRVVNLALRQDEETWPAHGIDVLEQFPLIDRQWEAVFQFRSQIVHRATLALREASATSTDICATILTLHLLESHPLTQTLTVFLSQRSRSLSGLLSFGQEKATSSAATLRRAANGHAPEEASSRESKPTARQIKDAAQAVLETVASTVKASRAVFENSSTSTSLAESVLDYIQSDSSAQSSTSLPTELQLTTESLLMTLPSSTHFMLLPANLKSYKPYVDRSSPSSHVTSADLDKEVSTWLGKAASGFAASLDRWFVDLATVKDVWLTRQSLRKWILGFDGFKKEETTALSLILDTACQTRISTIWQSVLSAAETNFRQSLSTAVATFGEHLGSALPMQNLFQNIPLPSVSSAGPIDASFVKYKSTVRKQLLGRTALLDDVLKTLESCARALQADMSHVLTADDADTSALIRDLKADYQPTALRLCSQVMTELEAVSESIADGSETEVQSLVFVGQVADELASNSIFVSNMHVDASTISDFRSNSAMLGDKIIDRWRSYTVSQTVSTYYSSPGFSNACSLSWNLSNSLISLTYAVQKLGLPRDASRQTQLVDRTLQLFINTLADTHGFSESTQGVFEVAFLQQVILGRDEVEWEVLGTRLAEYGSGIRAKLSADNVPDEASIEKAAHECLCRTQLLFGAIMSTGPLTAVATRTQEKLGGLLPLGVPSVDQREFQPVMEVSKAADGSLPQRFNEILVA